MIRPAKRDRELFTDLLSETAGLCAPQVVGIAGLPSADQAGLWGHKAGRFLVAMANGLGGNVPPSGGDIFWRRGAGWRIWLDRGNRGRGGGRFGQNCAALWFAKFAEL